MSCAASTAAAKARWTTRLVEVVAAALAGRGVGVDAGGREDPLPGPLAARVRELAGQGVGKRDVAGGALEVGQVLAAHALEMGLDPWEPGARAAR